MEDTDKDKQAILKIKTDWNQALTAMIKIEVGQILASDSYPIWPTALNLFSTR